MLALHYASGALLQLLGTFGGLWLTKKFLFASDPLKGKTELKSFCLFHILEASILGLLSFIYLLSTPVLTCWFWGKAGLGCIYLYRNKQRYQKLCSQHKWLCIAAIVGFMAICIPTANFDCFSAHFAITRLFLENQGYPIRPDYQYLDALPLAGHMWYLPGMAAGFEGALNALSLIFCFGTILLFYAYTNKRLAGLSFLVLCSMPQWIRVSLDPMMDTPSCFLSLYAWFLASEQITKKNSTTTGLFLCISCFTIALKPTLIAFPVIALILIFKTRTIQSFNLKHLYWALTAILAGGLWYLKNLYIHGNAFYPHLFAPSIAPNFPQHLSFEKHSLFISLYNYVNIILADPRWTLSYGPWPLIGMPFLAISLKFRRMKWLLLYLAMGFVVTWAFTSFKNRYFMPYLILAVPLISFWLSKSPPWVTRLLKFNVLLTVILFLPYFLQPVYTIVKSFSYEDYYTFKYPKFPVFRQINALKTGKILLVGQPAYWLKGEHQLAILSETNLDFSRIETLEQLKQQLKTQQIQTVVFDREDVYGMSIKQDPHYQKKAYLAKRCLFWMEALLNSNVSNIILQDKGMIVATMNLE